MPTTILEGREAEGGALHRVRLQGQAPHLATHKQHGQYIEVRYDGGWKGHEDATIPAAVKGTFVLVSPPGATSWELLVKEGGAMSDKLLKLPIGTELVTSDAHGKGFPYESAKGKPLVLAVTGSGIAAVLSLVAARIADGEPARTYMLYGVREKRDVSVNQELAAMRAAGVEVAICLSREHIDEPGYFKGYVQTVAADRKWKLDGGLLFAAGSRGMIEGLKGAATTLGLRESDVVLNF